MFFGKFYKHTATHLPLRCMSSRAVVRLMVFLSQWQQRILIWRSTSAKRYISGVEGNWQDVGQKRSLLHVHKWGGVFSLRGSSFQNQLFLGLDVKSVVRHYIWWLSEHQDLITKLPKSVNLTIQYSRHAPSSTCITNNFYHPHPRAKTRLRDQNRKAAREIQMPRKTKPVRDEKTKIPYTRKVSRFPMMFPCRLCCGDDLR